jgi:hypothetical protein
VIFKFRSRFNHAYTQDRYIAMQAQLHERCGMPVQFRVAETPVFLEHALLEEIAASGAQLCRSLVQNPFYLAEARKAIPSGFRVAGETPHPHFLTADFALVRNANGQLAPRLVEMQAFPSVYGFQSVLSQAYREAFALDPALGSFLSGLDESSYWGLLRETIVAGHDPETVVLAEVDPQHQKTLPDFAVTASKLGIAVVDIATIEPEGNRLTYRSVPEGKAARSIPITRIYNRAIADELIARQIPLAFDLEREWDVEWAGHPNWYFLVSKFSIPFLARACSQNSIVPPAVFLNDFLAGSGREQLEAAGVTLPSASPDAVYTNLLLKPLFSFAGKGIQFHPTQADLEAIPPARRGEYLLQQRMSFVPNVETPHGPTQAEIRILYLWPEGGVLTPVLPLVRLGRGRMMGVDHNRNQEWVGASAAFFPVVG